MKFGSLEIRAEPTFDARCPKHGNTMKELSNGWFSAFWYCGECKAPYEIKLVKLRKYNKEALEKALIPKNQPY
jgi:hypothetical protein